MRSWNRRLLASLALGVFALVVSSCNGPIQSLERSDLESTQIDKPVIFIHLFPGMGGPGSQVISGTVAAAWLDGTFVRAASEADVGIRYVQGHISPEQLNDLVDYLQRSVIIHIPPGGYIAWDAGSLELTIRSKWNVKRWGYSCNYEEYACIASIKEYMLQIPLSGQTNVAAEQYARYTGDWYE